MPQSVILYKRNEVNQRDEIYARYTYQYENGRISQIKEYFHGSGNPKGLLGIRTYHLNFSSPIDSVVQPSDGRDYDAMDFNLVINKPITIKEYIPTFRQGTGSVRKYDQHGRLIALYDFFDSGDSRFNVISFERYSYETNDKVWQSRKVERMYIQYEYDEFSKVLSQYDDMEFYDIIKEKILVLPKNFDQEKKTYVETRIVKKL